MFFRSLRRICSTASSLPRRTAYDSSTAIRLAKSPPPTFAALSRMSRRPHCLRLRATPPSQQMPYRTPAHRCTTDLVECSAESDGPKSTDRKRLTGRSALHKLTVGRDRLHRAERDLLRT